MSGTGRPVATPQQHPHRPSRWPVEYILPLRWDRDDGAAEMADYLAWLATRVDITVVDGSPPDRFAAHAAAWPGVRHVRAGAGGRNGKARGAVTGIRLARHERLIIADDDVRYDDASLGAVVERLDHADFVRPQNFFRPLPWHARWDTGRALINRALDGDFSGTVALRSDFARGGYDTDVLFENLELERTVRSRGGIVIIARDIYVPRLPPEVGRFAEQRVRQAYDEFARPARLIGALALLPLTLLALLMRRWAVVLGGAAAVMGLAELGRRRAGGRDVFRADAAVWALPWVLERAVTAWIALGWWLTGGAPYRGHRLRRAATPDRVLRRRSTPPRKDSHDS